MVKGMLYLARRWANSTKIGAHSRRYASSIHQAKAIPRKNWALALGVAGLVGSAAALHLFAPHISLDTANQGKTVEEVQSHTSVDTGVWVVINGKVYDLTDFLSRHPGGKSIILKYAGKNALAIFNKYHALNFVDKYLEPSECLGPLIGELEEAPDITATNEKDKEVWRQNLPPLDEIFTVTDFEYIARKTLLAPAWYYYSSGSDDEVTLRENHNAFLRIFFKPRVLVDIDSVDILTEMLGTPTSVPFYCSAAAQAKLGHPDGELAIARGCGKENVIQMISQYASFPLESIVAAAAKHQTQWYQLYFLSTKDALAIVKNVNSLGLKAIFVTVDTPELGRREKDMKSRLLTEKRMTEELTEKENADENDVGDDSDSSHGETKNDHDDLKSSVVYGRNMSATWNDIKDIQSWTDLPVAIKGVQSVEDIVLAAENGIKAVVLSNHGGRQLDYSRAPIEVLADAYPVLKEKGLDKKIEIYIDGGVRRGGDIIKCLALGARGVGLGRVFLYANACYGEAGVRKAIDLLREEIRIDMRLVGVSKLSELGPEHLDLRNLHSRAAPVDNLYYRNYEPLSPPVFGHEKN